MYVKELKFMVLAHSKWGVKFFCLQSGGCQDFFHVLLGVHPNTKCLIPLVINDSYLSEHLGLVDTGKFL